MFGITPMPIFDPRQEISYLREFMVFFRPGDVVKFRPIGRDAYDDVVAEVAAGRFEPRILDFRFSLEEFQRDTDRYNQKIGGALDGD